MTGHIVYVCAAGEPGEPPQFVRRALCAEAVPAEGEARLLRERFADDPAVIMVDLAPEFGTPTGGIKPELSDDFCHPNAAGYRIWAGKLQEIFERR